MDYSITPLTKYKKLYYLTVLAFVEQHGEVLLFGYRCHLAQSKLAVDTFLHI